MGTTYRFLSTPDEAALVLGWFRGLDPLPTEHATEGGVIFYFKHLGAITESAETSPIVNVFVPHIRCGVLTTAGEIHFLATPQNRSPELAKIKREFQRWISQFPIVHSFHSSYDDSFEYYLEGSLRNIDSDIYALPSGIDALKAGKYFVSDGEPSGSLNDLCKQLRLRGVEGLTQSESRR